MGHTATTGISPVIRLMLLGLGAVCLAGLGLAGAGAAASPEGPPTGWHHGHGLGVVLVAHGASGNGTPAITLAPVGPVGSSYSTGLTTVTVTNTGSATVSDVTVELSDEGHSPALHDATWACLVFNAHVLANEPLAVVSHDGAAELPMLSLAPHATATYAVVAYAGTTVDTGCGHASTTFHPPHTDRDAAGWYGPGLPYPAGTTNPAAASLPNAAQRGVLVLTLTTTYEARGEGHRCGHQEDAGWTRGAHDCD